MLGIARDFLRSAWLYWRAGELYKQGRFKEAFPMYVELAQLGNEFGQYHLGLMYFHGHGVEPNKEQAYDLWKIVISRTDTIPEAARMLGIMTYLGIGVNKNREEALEYFQSAASFGDKVSGYLIQQQKLGNNLDEFLQEAVKEPWKA